MLFGTGEPSLSKRKNLLFVIFSTEDEVSCKALLTSRDKVEIIKATFDYIAGKDGLWNRFPSSLLPP